MRLLDKATLVGDLSASAVVFLVALPLCLGIAVASGMPASAGLITGIVGGCVVGLIGGAPLQVSGPAAGLTLVVWDIVQQHGVAGVGLVLVLAGALQVCWGLLGAGRLFRAMNPAVVYGMLSGIGVLIAASQLHVMVDRAPLRGGLENLLAAPASLWEGLAGSRSAPLELGLLTLGVVVLWNRYKPTRLRSVPAPLLGVTLASAVAACCDLEVDHVRLPERLTDAIVGPALPTWARMSSAELYTSALSLALIASTETLLSAAAIDRLQQMVRTDYKRELIAQGVGNVLSGLLGALPMTGVVVRSAANVAAGARTRLSTIAHGLWIFLLLAFLPELVELVPTASLAAVLVYTGIKLIEPSHLRELRAYGAWPVAIYTVTLGGVVCIDLLSGVLAGLALSTLGVFVRTSSFSSAVHPRADSTGTEIQLAGALTFVGLPRLTELLDSLHSESTVHLRFDAAHYVDHACILALDDFERQHRARGAKVDIDWLRLHRCSDRLRQRHLGPETPSTPAHTHA